MLEGLLKWSLWLNMNSRFIQLLILFILSITDFFGNRRSPYRFGGALLFS